MYHNRLYHVLLLVITIGSAWLVVVMQLYFIKCISIGYINRGCKFCNIPKYNPSTTLTPNTDVNSKEIHMYTSNAYTYVSNIKDNMYNVCYKRLYNKWMYIRIMHMWSIIVYFRLYGLLFSLHMFIFECL